ncbi:hypothetical protein PPERSA_03805 [Pseudocohnilembus persalinus]|uniref:Uncharacterized protein n=1 Tax=Pseudocohnilembus persalinus TaxID=266149 RepID=A0A0V0QU60_PSEPJ|nr:hypothetical protein PPERSA_03805 [Pseudocohnilembus persalinus]|eukprot:KRX05868.1 hypothetical protein PPERSA_03805 [Pseudocohnilembus persalinus]
MIQNLQSANQDQDLQEISVYLQNLEEPISIKDLKNKFKGIDSSKINKVLKDLEDQNLLNLINLALPKFSEVSKASLDYIKYDSENKYKEQNEIGKTQNNGNQENQENQKNIQQQKNLDNSQDNHQKDKQLEDYSDQELYLLEQELIQQKEKLNKDKFKVNSKKNLIKAIQSFNTMKEICNVVFEKYAEINKLTLNEVCDQFGIEQKDREI